MLRELDRPRAKLAPMLLIGVVLSVVISVGVQEQALSPMFIAVCTTAVAISSVALKGMLVQFDRTDSLLWGNIALGVMFGLHPIAMILTGAIGRPFYFVYNLNPGYPTATQLGLLAVLAFNSGYFLQLRLKSDNQNLSLQPPRSNLPREAPELARQLAWALLVIALLAFSVFAVQSGSNVFNAIAGGARRGSNTSSSAYFYFAPQLIGPAALLFLYAAILRNRKPIAAFILVVAQILIFLPGGQRLVLLLALVPIPIAYFLLKKIRVKALTVALVLIVASIGVVSLRDLGTPDGPATPVAAIAETVNEPGEKVTELLTGPDTEMIDSLSLEVQVVPAQIDHAPASLFINVISAPIPSILWPGKPAPMDVILNQYILNVERNNASIAYSFVGELYFDGGHLFVVIGFLALGYISSRLNNAKLNTANPAFLILYAAFLPTLVSLMRGSLVYTLGRGLFTVFPLIVFWYLTTRQELKGSSHSNFHRRTRFRRSGVAKRELAGRR